jgi:hypothetical protein
VKLIVQQKECKLFKLFLFLYREATKLSQERSGVKTKKDGTENNVESQEDENKLATESADMPLGEHNKEADEYCERPAIFELDEDQAGSTQLSERLTANEDSRLSASELISALRDSANEMPEPDFERTSSELNDSSQHAKALEEKGW